MPAFGRIQSRLQCACIRWIAFHKLFVLNFTILLLNFIFYAVNLRFYKSTIAVHFLTPFEPEQRALLDLTFKAFAKAMDSNNVTYFVDGGTLLGSWRHHDLIPWDDDIDVLINASDRQEVSRVLQTTDSASFGLYDWAPSGENYAYQWKFYPLNGHRPLREHVYTIPNIDIFFYMENETHIWNACPYFRYEIWPKSHVFPLRRRPFGDLMVPAPCNPELFLGAHDVSVCESKKYNHVFEFHVPFPPVQVPCSRLAHLYPFVHREITESSGSEEFVLEKLIFRNSTLRRFKARRSC